MALCEMCGKEASLVTAEIEGVDLKVCPLCAKFGIIKKSTAFSSSFARPQLQPKPVAQEVEYKVVDNYALLLHDARERKGLSQQEFARFLNEKESSLAKWESGSSQPPLDTVRRLGRVLGLNLLAKEEVSTVKMEITAKKDEFTLGDFIKIRKKK